MKFHEGQEKLAKFVVAWQEMMTPYREKCIKLSGVDEDDVTNAFNTLNFTNNHKLSCYFECQEIQLKFVDPNGNFNISNLANTVMGTDEEMVKECVQEMPRGEDICNKGFSIVKCTVQKILAKLN
ncbi:hypothetical protein FQA39_LY16742 [Lamprigera yunnana]|nr:hypothetical protein FQA39_LY16742 [Lamprigera yunnana]